MTKKTLKSSKTNKKKLKFYFPKKILWNPFTFLDKKAKSIPKNLVLASLFFILSLFLLHDVNQRKTNRVLGLQTQLQADQKTAFAWEQILAERPNYRDGWIQLAAIYSKLGYREKALEALNRARQLDPNNETILSFEKILEGQK